MTRIELRNLQSRAQRACAALASQTRETRRPFAARGGKGFGAKGGM